MLERVSYIICHNNSVSCQGELSILVVPDDCDVVPLTIVDWYVLPIVDKFFSSWFKLYYYAAVRGLKENALIFR